MGLFTLCRLTIAARFITHKRAAVVAGTSNAFFFKSEMLFFAKSTQILIWVITLKSTNRTSVSVRVSMYEIILQRRSLCESQDQLQLDLSPRSECNMNQYKKEADL